MNPVTWRQLRNEQKKAERRNKIRNSGSNLWSTIWPAATLIFVAWMLARLMFAWVIS